jgi:hypothetical protein
MPFSSFFMCRLCSVSLSLALKIYRAGIGKLIRHLKLTFLASSGIDLVPLYPDYMKLDAFVTVRKWYIITYGDKNFTEPTAWFMAYTWMEALYHLPLSIWAVGALYRGTAVSFFALFICLFILPLREFSEEEVAFKYTRFASST